MIRLTRKLAERFKLKLPDSSRSSSSRLGDWYCHEVTIERRRFAFCISEHGRLPILFKVGVKTDIRTQLKKGVSESLKLLGISDEVISAEMEAITDSNFARATNRSALGILNQFKSELLFMISYKKVNPLNPQAIAQCLLNMASTSLSEFYVKDAVAKILSSDHLSKDLIPPASVELNSNDFWQTMSLQSLFENEFDEEIRARGLEYFESRQVRLLGCQRAPNVLEAEVSGYSSPFYDVLFSWRTGSDSDIEFRAFCSCPHYEDGAYCKHLWATILEIDKTQNISIPTPVNPKNIRLIHEFYVPPSVEERIRKFIFEN